MKSPFNGNDHILDKLVLHFIGFAVAANEVFVLNSIIYVPYHDGGNRSMLIFGLLQKYRNVYL